MSDILIVQTRIGVGDLCMFLPFIKKISFENDKSVDLLTKKRTQAKLLLKYEDYIDNIYYIKNLSNSLSNFFKIIYLILKKKYKKIYVFHFGIVFFFLKLIFPNKIYYYGIKKKNVEIFYFAKQKVTEWLKIDSNFDHQKLLTLSNRWPKFSANKKIVIGIGSSGLAKKWNIENYISLIEAIGDSYTFIIAGGINETNDFIKITNQHKQKEIINLCEKSLDDCIKYINGSEMYIGNDTGFMHISSFLNVKTLGLFGAEPKDYASYNNNILKILPEFYEDHSYDKKNLMNGLKFEFVKNIVLRNLN